jgi:hypothetical protein
MTAAQSEILTAIETLTTEMVLSTDASMEVLGSMCVRRALLIRRFLDHGVPDEAARQRIEHVIRMSAEVEDRLIALTCSLHREIAQLERSGCLVRELQVAAMARHPSVIIHA